MKKVLTLFAILFASRVFAGGIPDGEYQGKGLWMKPTQKGHYQVATTIQEGKIETHFEFADGLKKDWKFEMKAEAPNFFRVVAYGADIGQGYCLEEAAVCHYEIHVGSLSLEETLTFMDGRLYRFGSKDEGQGRIVWQENLEKK